MRKAVHGIGALEDIDIIKQLFLRITRSDETTGKDGAYGTCEKRPDQDRESTSAPFCIIAPYHCDAILAGNLETIILAEKKSLQRRTNQIY